MTIRRVLILALLSAIVAGCSWMPFFGRDDDEPEATSEQVLYQAAQRSLRAGNHNQAIELLQRLESQFPFGRYAEQAQLELIYAYYKAFRPESARSAADRFIRLHPQHPNVDYAYYLKGLAAYEQDEGFFDRFIPTDPAARDIGAARESFQDFSQLLARFPNSDYAPDARQRMIYLRNLLARSEILVGQYYLSREAYVAAVNRGRNVVENYPTTPAVPDGLALMIEGYLKLNLPENANDALRVLLENYPDFDMIDDEGNFVISPEIRNRDRSWLNVVSLGLLDRPDIPPTLQVRAPDRPEAAEPPQPPEMRPREIEDPQVEPTEPLPGPPPGEGQPGPGAPAPGPGGPAPGPQQPGPGGPAPGPGGMM